MPEASKHTDRRLILIHNLSSLDNFIGCNLYSGRERFEAARQPIPITSTDQLERAWAYCDFFLALSVIGAHADSTVFGFYGIRGQYVVDFFFFIISGFYMAMVLNGRYKETDPLHFYLNRVLRLFPTYYIGLLFA